MKLLMIIRVLQCSSINATVNPNDLPNMPLDNKILFGSLIIWATPEISGKTQRDLTKNMFQYNGFSLLRIY